VCGTKLFYVVVDVDVVVHLGRFFLHKYLFYSHSNGFFVKKKLAILWLIAVIQRRQWIYYIICKRKPNV
jgi:hypothetical protein